MTVLYIILGVSHITFCVFTLFQDSLQGYKSQNNFLNKEILELTVLRRNAESREKALEAKVCDFSNALHANHPGCYVSISFSLAFQPLQGCLCVFLISEEYFLFLTCSFFFLCCVLNSAPVWRPRCVRWRVSTWFYYRNWSLPFAPLQSRPIVERSSPAYYKMHYRWRAQTNKNTPSSNPTLSGTMLRKIVFSLLLYVQLLSVYLPIAI